MCQTSPLSPAIHLGAGNRLFIIGVNDPACAVLARVRAVEPSFGQMLLHAGLAVHGPAGRADSQRLLQ